MKKITLLIVMLFSITLSAQSFNYLELNTNQSIEVNKLVYPEIETYFKDEIKLLYSSKTSTFTIYASGEKIVYKVRYLHTDSKKDGSAIADAFKVEGFMDTNIIVTQVLSNEDIYVNIYFGDWKIFRLLFLTK